MTKIKPISSMTTPRFADVATFFRLPVVKDLKDLDYCICGVPWDGGTTNRPGARHGPREIRNSSSLVRLYHPASLKSPYGKECRECWTVSDPSKYVLVGTDASQLEIRCLAHYMNDPVFTKEIIIMPTSENYSIYPTAFITLFYGRKY